MTWLQRGALVCVLAIGLFAFPSQALAQWLRAESPRFIVYSQGDQRTLRDYVLQLETFDSMLRARHNLDPAGVPARKLPIYLVRGSDQLRTIRPEADDGIAGLYVRSNSDVFAIAIRDREDDDTLMHEYVHHFMLANFPSGYPGWLVEGYAEYYMTTDINPRRIYVGRHAPGRTDTLNYFRRWLPWDQVLANGPQALQDSEARSLYYAQAWLLTHYMLSDPNRMAQLRNYVRRLNQGGHPVAAFTETTGIPVDQLEAVLRAYMRGGMPYLELTPDQSAPPPVTITQLPASADDLLLDAQHLRSWVDEARGPELLARVRERAARHPADPFAQVVLARAELMLGDPAVADGVLDRVLEADPENVEALQLKAERLMAQGDEMPDQQAALYGRARAFLARAYAADNGSFQTLYALARSRRIAPDYPTDNDLETWLAANEMAPQLPSIRIEGAQALIQAGEFGHALTLLAPLVSDPHGGETAAAARSLVGLIQARMAGGAPSGAAVAPGGPPGGSGPPLGAGPINVSQIEFCTGLALAWRAVDPNTETVREAETWTQLFNRLVRAYPSPQAAADALARSTEDATLDDPMWPPCRLIEEDGQMRIVDPRDEEG
ncbi:hypothetical protein [Brevundimonas sp.]|uniref:hypothetical protein n=1 Tax=Brevundimonas sp. TaxID=1871086 RepID=UPI0025E4B3AA|nr:hypothetical protein [Brevundimonas sp.]